VKIAAQAQMMINVSGGLTLCPLASQVAWPFRWTLPACRR